MCGTLRRHACRKQICFCLPLLLAFLIEFNEMISEIPGKTRGQHCASPLLHRVRRHSPTLWERGQRCIRWCDLRKPPRYNYVPITVLLLAFILLLYATKDCALIFTSVVTMGTISLPS